MKIIFKQEGVVTIKFARIPSYASKEVNLTKPDYALVSVPMLEIICHDI